MIRGKRNFLLKKGKKVRQQLISDNFKRVKVTVQYNKVLKTPEGRNKQTKNNKIRVDYKIPIKEAIKKKIRVKQKLREGYNH